MIKALFAIDSACLAARRMACVLKYSRIIGSSCIEYGVAKSEVIWPRNTPESYIEEIIKINQNHFGSEKEGGSDLYRPK